MKMLAMVSFPLLVLALAMALTMAPQTNSVSRASGQQAGGAGAVSLSAATSPAQVKGQPATRGPEQILREMEVRFAAVVAAKDSQKFLAFWAEDAAMFPPGEPVVTGKKNILAQWAPILNDPFVSLTWSPDEAEISGSGDLGYTYGKYLWTSKESDGKVARRNGKYVTIWRKEPDGQWRVVVDLGTPSDPPAPAKPTP
jgi:ketosteroid isomerase-like protein